jgi:transcription initiation factor IIE alpha subunit
MNVLLPSRKLRLESEHLASELGSRPKAINCVLRLLSKLRVDISHPRILSRHKQSTYHVIMQLKAIKEGLKTLSKHSWSLQANRCADLSTHL